MPQRAGFLLLAMVWQAGTVWAATDALTLQEAYRLALARSESLAIQRAEIDAAEARFVQAVGTILPEASFSLSEEHRDGSGGSIPERKFTVSQPLFSGFREFAAMRGSRAERRQRVYERARAEHLLLVDVATAFYLVLQQREDLHALENSRSALMARIDELRDRERLGRSRASEVVTAEAQLRAVEAQILQVEGQETISRQLLQFLTGLPEIDALTDEPMTALPVLVPESTYLAKLSQRPDVRASREAVRVAGSAVTVARADYWPSVSLDSNYYTKRTGASSGIDWDAVVEVDVPLFQGGQTYGAVREARAERRQAELEAERIERAAGLDIRNRREELRSALAQAGALAQAMEAAERNYDLQREDYKVNLVSNLDVLQALQSVQDARRNFVRSAYGAKRLHWQLQAAVGETFPEPLP